MPVSCPICGSVELEVISEETLARPTTDGELLLIGGLRAYQCVHKKHTFFVRDVDLEKDD